MKVGDGIAFSSLTKATNVMPIIQLGFKPIPIDINKENLNIKEDIIYNLKNCKVLFVTNALGFCSDLKNNQKNMQKEKNYSH